MKFKSLLIPLLATVLLFSCNDNNNGNGGGGGQEDEEKIVMLYDVNVSVTVSTTEMTGTQIKNSLVNSNGINVTSSSKVYGGYENDPNALSGNDFLKFGSSSVEGTMTLKLEKAVRSITLSAHNLFGESTNYPTTGGKINVVGSKEGPVAQPYTAARTPVDVTFTFAKATTSIEIVTSSTTVPGNARMGLYGFTAHGVEGEKGNDDGGGTTTDPNLITAWDSDLISEMNSVLGQTIPVAPITDAYYWEVDFDEYGEYLYIADSESADVSTAYRSKFNGTGFVYDTDYSGPTEWADFQYVYYKIIPEGELVVEFAYDIDVLEFFILAYIALY